MALKRLKDIPGPRSIAGMRAFDPPWGRPLLGVSRAVTRALCAEQGIEVWEDPHLRHTDDARVDG